VNIYLRRKREPEKEESKSKIFLTSRSLKSKSVDEKSLYPERK